MPFAYYAGPEAVKGLQNFHDKGGKVVLLDILKASQTRIAD